MAHVDHGWIAVLPFANIIFLIVRVLFLSSSLRAFYLILNKTKLCVLLKTLL